MSSFSPLGLGLSRSAFALVLAGILGVGCAASTDDEFADTNLDRDAATGIDAPISEGDGSTEDAGDLEDSGDPGDEDGGVDSGQPDSGEDPKDGGFEDDADIPDANDGGTDADPGGAVCGDGKTQGNEECDDGNLKNDDGCDSNCRIEVPPTDYGTCPGKEITLTGTGTETRKGSISGNTTLLQNNYTATCSGASPAGKDAVFMVKPDVDGRLTARVTQASFDEILYGRTNCTATGSTSLQQCSASSTAHGDEAISFKAQKNVPYFLIVDSKDAQTYGSFTLEVEVTPGKCGNGVVDHGETCDDGNTTRGDGCDEHCLLEGTPARDACNGELLLLTGNPPSIKVQHGTANLNSNLTAPSGTPCYKAGNDDAVYQIVPAVDGHVEARLKSEFDASLYARQGSCTSATAANHLACSNAQPAGKAFEEVILFPVVKQTPYWIIVDSHDGNDGLYELEVKAHPAQCGNGVRDGNEECDGSDVPPGFLCDTDCTLWRPLDDKCPGEPLTLTGPANGPWVGGLIGTTLNYFDDAVSSTCHATAGASAPLTPTGPDASYVITPPADGQLRIVASSSAFNMVLHARSSCGSPTTELACVNAVTGTAGYEQLVFPAQKGVPVTVFVDAYQTAIGGPFTLDAELLPAFCGDGKLDGNEECDDGNFINGDGCSTTCKLEAVPGIEACHGHPLTLTPFGTGYIASITASTANLTNKFNAACTTQTFGPEAIFQITAPIAGKLTATAQGDFNVAVYHNAACPPSGTITCTNKATGTGAETHTVTVAKDATYYLYIDGITTGGGPASGVFKLDVSITP